MLDDYDCFSDISTDAGASATLELRMNKLYKAEKKAVNSKVVQESFAVVGLHPQ